MRSSARSLFTTIRTEGAILPSELLERIAKGRDFDGLSTDSYHLLSGQKLNEVIERSWKQVLVAWRGFKDAREKSGDLDATGTSLTRERWLYPLFQELGFGRMPAERKSREIDGREYAISHYYDHVPIHLVGYKILIDRRTAGIPGAAKTAPHSLVQEFLNRTEEHLWAIVSNGLRLRLLRDNKSLTRQAYVEFDLEAMMEGEAFADFRVLWLLCHQSRFEGDKPTDCWLEKWSKIANEQGVRALDKLRGGVEEAIRALGKGFLAHPANHELRARLRDIQHEHHLDRQDYYRQLLRVVYRLLFLFVAEDRDLLLLPELRDDEPDDTKRHRRQARLRYQQHYSTQRLRGLSQTLRGTQHPDLWRGLVLIMRGLGQEGGIPALAVPALGSYLWSEESCPDLTGSALYDPLPYVPTGLETNEPHLAAPFQTWVRPNPSLTEDHDLQQYALARGFDAYKYAEENLGSDLGEWANPILTKVRNSGRLTVDSFEELRCLLFFQQRAMRHWQTYGEEEVEVLRVVHHALCAAWDREWPAKRQSLVDAHQLMSPADIANADLLTAVRALAVIEVEGRRTVVNYAHLRSEELGSVYESLLELHPNLNAEAGTFDLHSAAGNERKTTGSYYTPDSLVQCLLDSALEPIMDEKEKLASAVARKIDPAKGNAVSEREKWSPEELDLIIPRGADPEEALAVRMVELLALDSPERHRILRETALLGMRVCDPACGSGHFLIAAAHRIARRLARVRTGDEEPAPEAIQHAMRDVVGRCLYGVDINPMALELAKVALWMEAIEPGKPLGFLDAHFQCGNALLGTTPELIAGGLPDGAFTALTGDDKKFVSSLKRINKDQREGQLAFLDVSNSIELAGIFPELQQKARALFEANADSLADVQRIAANYEEFRRSSAFRRARFVADLWCVAFVWPKVDADVWAERITDADAKGLPLPGPRDYPEPPTHDLIQRCAEHPEPWKLLSDAQRDILERLVGQFRFIQWHVLFADVFRMVAEGEKAAGGFDCMLGNPPWERVKLQEKEFFAQRAPEIANAANAAARKRAIRRLAETDPSLLAEFAEAHRQAEGESHFMRSTDAYPLCGRGDINVYTIFAELGRCRLSLRGRMGFVLPSGIATDDTTKFYFQDIINTHSLVSLFDLENRQGIFPAVDSRMKFCLFTCGSGRGVPAGRKPGQAADFVFFAHSVDDIRDPERRFSLTAADIKTLNPNTMTCPIFRGSRDAELAKVQYHSSLPLGNIVTFLPKIDMSDEVHLFAKRSELQPSACTGQLTTVRGTKYLRLFESKLIWHYDHRFSTFADLPPEADSSGNARYSGMAEKIDPKYFSIPRYFVPRPLVADRYQETALPLLAVRRLTNATNERTAIFTVVPEVGCGNSMFVLVPHSFQDLLLILTSGNSFAFDYAARNKMGGTNFLQFIIQQLPLPMLSEEQQQYCELDNLAIELSYTAWDLEPFARDCGYDGPPFIWDEERRFWIRAELDAAFFHLYLGTPEDWTRTGSPELLESFPTPRHAVDYIMETFPIVKRKDIKAHGTYRTKEAILDIYDKMAKAIVTGEPYQTTLSPPSGPPVDAEGNFIPMAQWDPNNWPTHIHPPREEPIEVEIPAVAAELIPVPGMDSREFEPDHLVGSSGIEAFAWAIIPRLLMFESPMPFGIARDATLLASDPVAMKLLLDEVDAMAVEAVLPHAAAIDFTPDKRRVRFAELTDGLDNSKAVHPKGTTYYAGQEIESHLREHPVPEFLNRLLPLAVKAARRMEELRVIHAREHQFANAQEQKAYIRITAREEAIA